MSCSVPGFHLRSHRLVRLAAIIGLLVVGSGQATAQDPATPAPPAPAANLPAHTRWVIAADYTTDGAQLLTSGGESLLYRPGDAAIWNPADGRIGRACWLWCLGLRSSCLQYWVPGSLSCCWAPLPCARPAR